MNSAGTLTTPKIYILLFIYITEVCAFYSFALTDAPAPTWEQLSKGLEAVRTVVHGLVDFIQNHSKKGGDQQQVSIHIPSSTVTQINSNRTMSKNFFRILTATPAQQVQDLHVPRHETEGRLSSRSKLHIRSLAGRTGKVSIFRPNIVFHISIRLIFCSAFYGRYRKMNKRLGLRRQLSQSLTQLDEIDIGLLPDESPMIEGFPRKSASITNGILAARPGSTITHLVSRGSDPSYDPSYKAKMDSGSLSAPGSPPDS